MSSTGDGVSAAGSEHVGSAPHWRPLRAVWEHTRELSLWARSRPPSRMRRAALLVWVGFIIVPVLTALAHRGSGAGHWLVVAATVAFDFSYVWLVFSWLDSDRPWLRTGTAVLQVVITIVLTLADRSDWGFLFSYCAACVALVAPSPYGFSAMLATSVIAVGVTLLGGANSGNALGYGASAVGVGLLLTLMRDLRSRNDELQEARAELARTAVAAERERFARDLHDLLGHTLSVIAIKAELAGRLLPDRLDDAAREVRDVETVARNALGEVRDAVSGYRQPTLAGEMEGARMALAAAGIMAEFQRSPVSLDSEVEAVLAWAVREGATNVIRHSGASRCQVRVLAGLSDAEVEVIDDGAGCQGAREAGSSGNGLPGLRERAERLRGQIDAGSLPDGGFRLRVSVPVRAARA